MFDLDPATNEHATVPARHHCTGPKVGGEDGRVIQWFGHVWLNFPFSESNLWAAKVLKEAERMFEIVDVFESVPPATLAPRTMTVLGPGDQSVAWWRALRSACDARAMWPRREHFPVPGQLKGSPPGPVGLFFFGPRSNYWRRVLEAHGIPTEAGAIA